MAFRRARAIPRDISTGAPPIDADVKRLTDIAEDLESNNNIVRPDPRPDSCKQDSLDIPEDRTEQCDILMFCLGDDKRRNEDGDDERVDCVDFRMVQHRASSTGGSLRRSR